MSATVPGSEASLGRRMGLAPAALNGLQGLPSVDGHPTVKRLVHGALRERIVFGELLPGSRLVETDLAARFGVSKTPVREALLTLEMEGLVQLRAHHGATVTPLSAAEYHDIQYTRDALEFGALPGILTALTDADLARAEAHYAAMAAATAAHAYRDYRAAQRHLHRVLLHLPGCPTLTDIALNLHDRMDRYAHLIFSDRPAWWAAELEITRQRLDCMQRRDSADLIHRLSAWHGEVVAEVARRLPAS